MTGEDPVLPTAAPVCPPASGSSSAPGSAPKPRAHSLPAGGAARPREERGSLSVTLLCHSVQRSGSHPGVLRRREDRGASPAALMTQRPRDAPSSLVAG